MTTSPAKALAQAMIGEPGSRYRLPTPALVLDEAALDANIAAMAGRVRGKAGLRPHTKTHKSAWIARKQIAQGAVGVCCANSVKPKHFQPPGCAGYCSPPRSWTRRRRNGYVISRKSTRASCVPWIIPTPSPRSRPTRTAGICGSRC